MLKTFTTSDELLQVLNGLMKLPLLANFRLVGGTALSLIYGHRKSEDIDLFAYEEYGSIDFKKIETELIHHFPYVRNDDNIPGLGYFENNFGLHLHVGKNSEDSIKTDILNWSVADFINPVQIIDQIRLSTPLDIALMKLDTISRGGRKKDFWDMSELLEHYRLPELLRMYGIKYPYHAIEDVITGMVNFDIAENMPDPVCLKGKYWEHIKEEMLSATKNIVM